MVNSDTPEPDAPTDLSGDGLGTTEKPASTMPKPSWWMIASFAIMFSAVLFVTVTAPTPEMIDEETTTTAGVENPVGTRAVPNPDVAPVEVSEACDEAARTIRDLAARTPSALALDNDEAAELTAGLTAIGEACDTEEYRSLTEVELSGWLLAPPGA